MIWYYQFWFINYRVTKNPHDNNSKSHHYSRHKSPSRVWLYLGLHHCSVHRRGRAAASLKYYKHWINWHILRQLVDDRWCDVRQRPAATACPDHGPGMAGLEELGGLNVSLGWEWEAGGASDLPTSGHTTTAWLLQLWHLSMSIFTFLHHSISL